MCRSLRDFVDYRRTMPITLLCFVVGILSFRCRAGHTPVPAVDHHQHLFKSGAQRRALHALGGVRRTPMPLTIRSASARE